MIFKTFLCSSGNKVSFRFSKDILHFVFKSIHFKTIQLLHVLSVVLFDFILIKDTFSLEANSCQALTLFFKGLVIICLYLVIHALHFLRLFRTFCSVKLDIVTFKTTKFPVTVLSRLFSIKPLHIICSKARFS